jgi:hypothetical protein
LLQPNSKKQQRFRLGTDNSLGYQPQTTRTSMHLIDLIEEELQAYRETGPAIHLAHAARGLREMRKTIQRTQLDGSKRVGSAIL